MKAAIIVEAGQAPVYGEFRDPEPASGKRIIRVTAFAISHVTRSRATGSHYSSAGALPFIPGIDGVGLTENGKRVYFAQPEHPFGAMAERTLVDADRCIPLPAKLNDVSAAALAIAGMSSWAGLVERAQLRRKETVMINGAAGASGRLAIQIAKHLGAGRVIATGRNTDAFDDLRRLGADAIIPLVPDKDALGKAFEAEFERGVGVVLDYLWGPSAEAILIAAARVGEEAVPIRYVEIGSASASEITLPSAVLRSSAIQLMGSGIGSVPAPRLLKSIQGVLEAAPGAGFEIATQTMPLSSVTQAWSAEAGSRIVLVL